MTLMTAARAAPRLLRHPEVVLARREYVLIVSHMRSYSSVLSHVLGSQEEIAGYSEMHQSYERRVDFLRARTRVARSLDGRLDGRFVLDKVLHDHHPVAPEVLDRDDVRPIFLVRRPAETVASILAMGRKVTDIPWFSEPGTVAAYYAQRVRTLAGLARSVRSPALFVPAEAVVGDTDAVLAAVARHLGLAHPIGASYRTFKHTGEARWGDYSDHIRSGRIERRGERSHEVELPEELLTEPRAAYEDYLAAVGDRGLATRVSG